MEKTAADGTMPAELLPQFQAGGAAKLTLLRLWVGPEPQWCVALHGYPLESQTGYTRSQSQL